MEHGLGSGFAGLEDDIAGETVAENDFDRILEEVVALDVAAEVESARPEEFENFFGELAALGIFAADRHQPDGRVFVTKNVARKDGAHNGVLQHVVGACVGVGSGVDENAKVRFGRQKGGNTRAVDALEIAQLDRRGGDGGPGMAGTDHGIRLPVFDQVDRTGNGGVLFAAEAIDRAFAHLDDLSGVDNLDARIPATMLVEFGADLSFIPDQEESFQMRKLAESKDGTRHAGLWRVVAAHCIERNLHRRRAAGLSRPDGKNLAPFVVAAGRTGGVRRQFCPALGAGAEFAGMPAVGCLAGAQAHFGYFAFRDGHKKSAFGFELFEFVPSRRHFFRLTAPGGLRSMVGTAMIRKLITPWVVWQSQ